jgi:hypothetical protein
MAATGPLFIRIQGCAGGIGRIPTFAQRVELSVIGEVIAGLAHRLLFRSQRPTAGQDLTEVLTLVGQLCEIRSSLFFNSGST